MNWIRDKMMIGGASERARAQGDADQTGVDSSDPPSVVARRSGRVLVVDDDPAICNALRRVFSRNHHVTTVTGARDALDLFARNERFELVLCDLMMPEFNGAELYSQVQGLAPDQAERFVFMSGASLTAAVSALLSGLPNTLLSKPFDMQRLTDFVKMRVDAALAAGRQ